MITSIIRNQTQEEKQQQIKGLPGPYKRFERFMVKFIFVTMILLAPLLIYDHYYHVAPNPQAVFSVAAVILSFLICLWWIKKYEGEVGNKQQIANVKSVQVEVVKVNTKRAIKREDPEDFGIAYYIEVTENGKQKTLYLWGQYLDELEYDNQFPNTEFEFTRKAGSDEFIDFKITGQHFQPEQTLPPFTKEVWKSGNYPLNGQVLNQTIDSIN